MQIHEITAADLLNEQGFLSGVAQGLGVDRYMPKTDGSSGGTTTYGPAAQQAAAEKAAPLINQMAQTELKNWNASVLDLLRKNNVQSPAQLDAATKQSLSRSLLNQLHSNFMRGKSGDNYKNLSSWVAKESQPAAQAIVKRIEAALNNILNFNKPAQDQQTQLAQWQELAKSAYDAMSLVQFSPARGGRRTAPAPAARSVPPGSWIKTNTGVEIAPATRQYPTMARYQSKVYSLSDSGNWLDAQGKPATATMVALLTKALDQT